MPKAKKQLQASHAPQEGLATAHAPLEYEINIYPSRGDGAQKAGATVNINGQFAIRGLKIMEGSRGLFVSMPSFKAGNGEYKDICFPCTTDEKARFDKAVLTAYAQKMEQSQADAPQQESPQQEQGQQMAGM